MMLVIFVYMLMLSKHPEKLTYEDMVTKNFNAITMLI